MPSTNDYLSAIRTKYPTVNVDPSLMTELTRRSKENATVDQVLNDAAGYSQTQISNPAQVNKNIQAASVTPVSPTDIAGYNNTAAGIFDPQKKALTTDLEAKLKQRLQASDTGLQTDLSSRGFLRSGEQITRSDLSRTVAEADLALQEAGYLSDINTKQNAYAQQLQSEDVATREANATAALKNQATSMGITQQEFDNMQTELTRIANQKSTEFTQGLTAQNQAFTQGNTTASLQYALESNTEFQSMVAYAKSDPQAAGYLKTMLINMGLL